MKVLHALASVAALAALAAPPASLGASDADDGARAEIRKVTSSLLQNFYAARPRLIPEIKAAAGYAVFTTYSGNLMGSPTTSGGKGVGLALNTRNASETFMAMAQTSPDPKALLDRELLIVFSTQAAFDEFALRGWKDGAASPDAKVYGWSSGKVEIAPPLAGARFWNDSTLN